ncbi:MAG: NAD-dependent epimerase/dehydratase family protein [Gemmatimonadaceae bacterium]|nr:NAD-dependent epimerase/dehydratase family protein [Gemmatimonadaceae bacterium]
MLITGGAGFIGRHVARALVAQGHAVRVLDSLERQVHVGGAPPADLHEAVELVVGDVRNPGAVASALRGIDSVVHLAAQVGVGQSMYQVSHYVSHNDAGTAALFQELTTRPVRRVVTASSMSIYGEGLYRDADGALHATVERAPRGDGAGWDPVDGAGRPLVPVATPEWKQPSLASVYALGKFVQERLTMTLAPAYGMEGCCLRLFNVYGPGQALSNPYTGVLAIFASRLANGRPPMIFEDGEQRRDFVHVDDVARAFVLALEHPRAPGGVFNIGSGHDVSVAEVAHALAGAMEVDIAPEITQQARVGDVRHCFADVTRAADVLGFRAERRFRDGLAELAEWVASQEAHDHVGEARRELEQRGLVA